MRRTPATGNPTLFPIYYRKRAFTRSVATPSAQTTSNDEWGKKGRISGTFLYHGHSRTAAETCIVLNFHENDNMKYIPASCQFVVFPGFNVSVGSNVPIFRLCFVKPIPMNAVFNPLAHKPLLGLLQAKLQPCTKSSVKSRQ